MSFISFEFFVFLVIVFCLYWFVFQKNLKTQNFFVLIVSYIFYGWWDYRFLSLIFISTVVDFLVGRELGSEKRKSRRKVLLWISLSVNLGLLFFFKYFGFFVDNFISLLSLFGYEPDPVTLRIILPVGISFYTFQTLSYTIDIYRDKIKPTKDFILFSAYVSFFPQLVAGPIERAANLIPQFEKPRLFDSAQARDGLKQILWGFFMKVAVADVVGVYVNEIFDNYSAYSGVTLIFGLILFIIQVYGDFAGYSYIAIGTAKLFGFSLMNNFAYPFFARDLLELWRRWHISLTTWLRDYIFYFLSRGKRSKNKVLFQLLVVFIVTGFWHGANWTFIAFGLLNGIIVIIIYQFRLQSREKKIVAYDRRLPNFRELRRMFFTFMLFALSSLFFRSPTITDSYYYFIDIFRNLPSGKFLPLGLDMIFLVLLMFIIEWNGRRNENHPINFENFKPVVRYSIYFTLFYFAVAYYSVSNEAFIYFQF